MTPQQCEQLRLSLLRYLDLNPARWGLSASLLCQFVRNEGSPASADDVERELDYLKDKGLVIALGKLISPELLAWKISASGRDYLASR